ncbi:MAG: chromosome segregation protein SMC [Streptosporangiales bacterium]|nr:chromosome segregation protein SMC [Streptosporangiales bacterium]
MYLKNLTLRGFKSFASATSLRFEPGITCVVGPNGSGKSNVVDALAWVMGEQGVKSLRGGKMEDVIFAGTSSRPALGRAEVSLTIDNHDGALPIDYTEVTITRTMFRSGGSEYAINGDHCRLLDVQELLSDSGIGREMHVIVGQGQLDTVLHAGPEERRALIEEAAGILKHRKRKEKALRKLDAMQANLTRLTDLTAELRRQLKPLGRQAEIARRAAIIQAELRDARLRLLADDVLSLRTRLEREEADEAAVRERRQNVERDLAEAQRRETELDERATAAAPELSRAQDTYHRLSQLRERLRGSTDLAAERHRNLAAEPADERRGRDPEELEREAAEIREQEEELTERLELAREAAAAVVDERTTSEEALQAEERRVSAAQRAAADRREGLAKLRGRVDALRSRLAASESEVGRLAEAAAEARSRAASAQAEYEGAVAESDGAEDGDAELEAAIAAAGEAVTAAEERRDTLREAERLAERERAALAARKDALEPALNRKDGTGTLLAAGTRLSGVLGTLAALLTVEPGVREAVAAALGRAADAVAVAGPEPAAEALRLLKKEDAGQAALLVGGPPGPHAGPPRDDWPRLPGHARYALDAVTAPPGIAAAVAVLLDRVAVVEDLDAAADLVAAVPGVRAVTRDGDVLGRGFAHGGTAAVPSLLEVQAAVDEATARLAEATADSERLRAELAEAKEQRAQAVAEAERYAGRRREAERRRSEIAQLVGRLGGQARGAAGEAERLEASIAKAEAGREEDLRRLAELEERLAVAEAEPDEEISLDTAMRDELAERCAAARAAEMDARLAVRTAEERVRAIAGRADGLLRAAAREREAREQAAERRLRRRRHAEVAADVVAAGREALRRIERSLAVAGEWRETAERERADREAELKVVRTRVRELSVEHEKLVSVVHGSEVTRAEQRLRLEQLETRAIEELGVEVEVLIREYGPSVPVPPPPDAEDAVPLPYVREVQAKRAKTAERQLAQLGKVNPLALEEYAALEERHAFLSTQLEDLKKTRRDLLTVVAEVDERVEQVFTAAYGDVEREFEKIFARLFPGGEGRLVLTDPEDMLSTGVEVEARPPGKKVKRLSLLSGGERSLTAVAFLVAIFKARPSPFYVLDEVEAALDDTNLQRLIMILEELRESSQLIVITHQKRTMECADALYGVSMRGDGISNVISQRMREAEAV